MTSRSAHSSATLHLMPAALLTVATVTVFWPLAGFDFLSWDDNINVSAQTLLDRPTGEVLREFWSQPHFSFYIPITRTIWLAVARLTSDGASLSPRPFHLLNVAFHCFNVLLVFSLLRRLSNNGAAALAGGLLFALHPLQVEPVAWVTGFKDVLGAFFGLSALWFYLPASRQQTSEPHPKRRYVLATLLYALGLLSKPGVVAIPLIACVLDLMVVRRSARETVSRLVPWMLLAIPVMLVTRMGEHASHVVEVAPWARPLIAADALAFYIGKLLAPVGLATDYGRRPAHVLTQPWLYYTWIAPAVLGVLIYSLRRRLPWLSPAALIALAALLPVLGFVPFVYQEYSTVADRYMYPAMLGPAIAIAFALRGAAGKWTLPAIALAGLVLGSLSAVQVGYWRSDISLCQRVIAVNPRSWMAYTNLGRALGETGDMQIAVPFFARAVELRPDWAPGQLNLAIALRAVNQTGKALPHFRAAVDIAPDDALYRARLAEAFGVLGAVDEALDEYERAISLAPGDATNHLNIGLYLASLGRHEEAIGRLRTAVRIDPELLPATANLAIALASADQSAEAAELFERLLAQRPYDVNLLYNYAGVLIDLGRNDEAIEHLQKVLSIRGDFQAARDALARAVEARDR